MNLRLLGKNSGDNSQQLGAALWASALGTSEQKQPAAQGCVRVPYLWVLEESLNPSRRHRSNPRLPSIHPSMFLLGL